MQRGLPYLLIIFGLLPFQISPKFFFCYRAPWLKGWAGHTSINVKSELLLVIEYTTYMIVTWTQSPLMSLLESWNWGGILGGNPDRSLKSFPPCYSQTPLLTDCTPHLLFFGLEISTSNSWEGGGVFLG